MRTQATDHEPASGQRSFRPRARRNPMDPSIVALSEDAEAALELGMQKEGVRALRHVWRATFDPWHLTRLGFVLFRQNRLRRACVALECAAGMAPFHQMTASLLVQVARAQGDQAD